MLGLKPRPMPKSEGQMWTSDVETGGGKCFPVWRRTSKNFPHVRRRQNHKSRPVFVHEFGRVLLLQWRHPAFHSCPEIPNQARFLKIDRAEFHFWSQLLSSFSKKLGRWKKLRREWRRKQRERKIKTDRESRGAFQKTFALDVSRSQQREQRKRQQCVMRQLRFDQSEDDEDNSSAAEQINVELVAFAPKFFRERWKLNRPREKTGEDGDEIERQ